MIDNSELQSLAGDLGVDVVGPLAGGEFGAMLSIDRAGRELVLKTMSPPAVLTSRSLASIFERGVRLAGRLRAIGYPAPEYVGTGGTPNVAWSLQERLPGDVPDSMTARHAQRRIELAKMHKDAAGESNDWRSFAFARMREHMETVVQDERAAPLARELASVVEHGERVQLRQNDVVHADFHHRNYLAIGDEITGVFDWEFALSGDWRVDLVTLAFWCAIDHRVPPDAARIVVECAREDVSAGCAGVPRGVPVVTATRLRRARAPGARRGHRAGDRDVHRAVVARPVVI
ncbi:MAG: phosphotransferase [Dehalococcoidia bacterium]